MKKTLLVLLLFGVSAAIYYYFFVRKKPETEKVKELSAPEPPPKNNSIADPNAGLGLAAIERRIAEIRGTEADRKIQNDILANYDILRGVADFKRSYYNQNISRDPITSAKSVPLNIGQKGRAALSNFLNIDRSAGQDTTKNLYSANQQMMEEIGTCFVGNPELSNQREFDKQTLCQGYANCGKNYKYLDNSWSKYLKDAAAKMADDMKKIASNWLEISNLYDLEIRSKAINDLRASGWAFIGFD